MTENRHGFCHCGCGEKTPLSDRNDPKRGYVKGQPHRFLPHHGSKRENHYKWVGGKLSRSSGYVIVLDKEHPRASKGYVFEHVRIAEAALGHGLPPGAQVHHVNGDRSDNRPENLVVCQDQSYHRLLHRRQKALEACGHADWRLCKFCQKYDSPGNVFVSSRRDCESYHRECNRDYQRRRKAILRLTSAPTLAALGTVQP